MNNKDSMEGRVILTVIVILGIWLGWRALFPPPQPPKQVAQQEAIKEKEDQNKEHFSNASNSEQIQVTKKEKTIEKKDAHEKPEIISAPVAESFTTLDFPESKVTFSSKGYIADYELKKYTKTMVSEDDKEKKKIPINMVAQDKDTVFGQLKLVAGKNFQPPKDFVISTPDKDSVLLKGTSENDLYRITYKRVDPYIWDIDVTVTNNQKSSIEIAPVIQLAGKENDKKSSFLMPQMDILNLKCLQKDKLIEESKKSVEQTIINKGAISWAAVDRQYFISAIGPHPEKDNPTSMQCSFEAQEKLGITSLIDEPVSIAAHDTKTFSYRAFLGPKNQEFLKKGKMHLEESISYNIWGIPLAFLAKPMLYMLDVFYGITKSYGLAIILLTILVKLLVFPVNHKSLLSMRAMQTLKPMMDDIKKKYPSDKEAQSRELLKLYQEQKVNPLLGGCLPALIQMPIYLALYRSLWSAVELYQQSFMWIPDLTAKEPFPFLAISLGIATYLQQRLSPTVADNQQAKIMMYFMPIFLTFIMIALPSGLVLYIFVNTILTIAHQLYINRRRATVSK